MASVLILIAGSAYSVDAAARLLNAKRMARSPTFLPELDGMMDIVSRYEAACAAEPALQGTEMDELLRLVPGKHAVISGTWHGRQVVFRFFLEPDSPEPAREWGELTRVWPMMQDPSLRIAAPLHFAPDHQLIILEQAPGQPLMQHIWQSEPSTRAKWLRPAANWLRTYTSGTEAEARSRSGVWLGRAEKTASAQPHPRLARREALVIKQLRRLEPKLGHPWRSAITHGDFHPNNLLVEGDTLIGIDCGGSAALPIYKDMARFLMHMGRRGLIPSGEARFGVDAKGIDAFADAFDLSPYERDLVLPFMLGCEALLRVEHARIKSGRVRRAIEMTDQLASDLTQV